LANIEKSCKGICKSKYGIFGGEQAKELFMFHAFKHANRVTNDFKNISMEIIKT
jgi:hypothetical protein